jgi:hypothetical protein
MWSTTWMRIPALTWSRSVYQSLIWTRIPYGVWFFPNSFCNIILISDFRELKLDRESYPNSIWNRTVDQILRGVLIGHRLWLLIRIFCGTTDTWVPVTCLSWILASWVDSQSRDVCIFETQSGCYLPSLILENRGLFGKDMYRTE